MADITLSSTLLNLVYASLGGIVPALLWLWFWLQEDKLHPEPRSRIMLCFLGGMAAVPLVYFPEKYIVAHFGASTPQTLFLWAVIEETIKLAMVWLVALRTRDYDEPIDAMEYLVTVALGFAALENALYILGPLLDGNVMQGLVAGNERFIGASLLHVVSSAVLGYAIGREFYRSRAAQSVWLFLGLALAIALHTVFNEFILYENGSETFFVFGCVWAAALGVLLLFEKIKALARSTPA